MSRKELAEGGSQVEQQHLDSIVWPALSPGTFTLFLAIIAQDALKLGCWEAWVCSGVQRSARIPRGGWARVHERNDLNIWPARSCGRSTEVIADGLPV